MRSLLAIALFAVCLALALPGAALSAERMHRSGPHDVLIVSGTVTNAQEMPVEGVRLRFLVNGRPVEAAKNNTTSGTGSYESKIILPKGELPGARVEIQARKPCFRTNRIVVQPIVKEKDNPGGGAIYLAHMSFSIARAITPAFWISTAIMLAVYILIAFELMHRTLAAFLGGALLLGVTYTAGSFSPDYFILPFNDAIRAIDMNVIFLLMAMMIIVGVLKKTGVFQWLALKSYLFARGSVFGLAAILLFVTAVVSAFLDNVTTMLLIIPVTIEIAVALKIDPIALLIPEAFASNVGGTATLIGDPPNIMIGSFANLTFLRFLEHLTIICSISLAVVIIYFIYLFKNDYIKSDAGDVEEMTARLCEEYRITDRKLLAQGCVILGITIFMFVVHGFLHMEPSIAAMIGAAVLVVISRVDIVEILEQEIEWPTLVFFMMLFIVVAGAEDTGLIQIIADWVRELSRGSLVVAVLLILWVSALASAIIDNIPFTATMLPVVGYLTTSIPGAEGGVLWWALALGACLGGNGTLIGASANVVTVGMAERAGYPVSFMRYLKIAFIPMLITVGLCSVWLLAVEI